MTAGPGARQRVGRRGEQAAADFLELAGWTVLARNLRTPYGEIDLLARDGETLVFVEVKARRNDAFGLPETGITARKQAHLTAAAQAYLMEHPEEQGDWRIDVIAIRFAGAEGPQSHAAEIVHFENAVVG
jgi:putative endonuclease